MYVGTWLHSLSLMMAPYRHTRESPHTTQVFTSSASALSAFKLYACMCMYMYVCVCMYTYLYIYMYVCVYVCMYVCMYVSLSSLLVLDEGTFDLTDARASPYTKHTFTSSASALSGRILIFHVCIYVHMYVCMYMYVCDGTWNLSSFLVLKGLSQTRARITTHKTHFYLICQRSERRALNFLCMYVYIHVCTFGTCLRSLS
jgi:hypothetical protein